MDGRSSTVRRVRARLTRAALVAVVAVAGLLALPGTASAAWKVEPTLDCHMANADGSRTLVFGHTSYTWGVWNVPHGKKNDVFPSRLQGTQPTAFPSGTVHGAFTARVTAAELRSGARWELEGFVLDFSAAIRSTSPCPASTELPEEGNGTGPAFALLGAGLVGVVVVQRARRRALAGRGDA